ncbi:MAG: RluA family pseudouridine synthase [Kiritimatiellae bacterium]|nr:RluA family pseudouridine synthase [Kiritimatiellia bacterium]
MEFSDDTRRFEVPAEGIARLDTWLVQMCEGFSRNRIQGLIDAGFVKIDGAVAEKTSVSPPPGAMVEVFVPPPVPAVPEPEDIPLSILFEDDDVIVLDKQPGLVVHPAPGHNGGTLVNALLHHCPTLSGIGGVARPGIVHRLDRDTSGVMVVAKNETAMRNLARAFASHDRIRKTYLALAHGIPSPPAGRIENLMARKPSNRKKMAVVEEGGKVAITEYRIAEGCVRDEFAARLSLVECRIETGRTHQIRVHLASLGCPVAGDAAYGRPSLDKTLNPPPMRQLLHAWRLELPHPATGEPLKFVVPPPTDFSPYLCRFPD